jgi:hypothetical protein
LSSPEPIRHGGDDHVTHNDVESTPVRPFRTGTTYRLRDLTLVLSTRWHPDTEAWIRHSESWIGHLLTDAAPQDRPLLKISADDAVLWACVCYPETVDAARMLDIVRMAILYVVIDDCIYTSFMTDGQIGVLINEFATAVADPDQEPTTFTGRFLVQTWREMSTRMPQGLRARWINATEDYMRGTAAEVVARAAGAALPPADYRAMREDSMGAKIVHLLGEYSIGVDVSDQIADVPKVFDEIHEVAGNHFMYVNDLFSFRKEYCDGGDFEHNGVYTGVVSDGLPLQQSIERLCAKVEESERAYRALEARVLAPDWGTTRAMIQAYLRQVERGMAGSRDYSYLAARYHGAGFARPSNGHFVPTRTSGLVVLQPERTVFLDSPDEMEPAGA